MKRRANLQVIIGIGLFAVLILIAVCAPLLAPEDPTRIMIDRELCPPSKAHLLGCDVNGTDILSILIYGTRISLMVGLTATFISCIVGLILGSLAGWYEGKLDSFLMRVVDIVFAFPGILLAIALASALGPSIKNIVLCLVATGWAGYTRLVRGEVRNIKTMEYIQAAQALGYPSWWIIYRHIWPNLTSPVIVTASIGVAGCVLAEASLSFLGVGVPPGTPSWGSLLQLGKDVLVEAPHVAAFAGIAIMLTVFSCHFLGEGIRELADPKA
jgi:peptide/nickel transport system permease protein